MRSAQIQRVCALLELLRGITAFLVAPILLYLATVIGPSAAAGTRTAIWICLAIAVGGVLVTLAVFVLGGGRLQAPDLETWQNDGSQPGITAAAGPAARQEQADADTGSTPVERATPKTANH